MAIALAALITLLATLGAVALGGRISRRNEQQQWLRDECNGCTWSFSTPLSTFRAI
jgi:hypothetical protein